jgi:hypothetical protein
MGRIAIDVEEMVGNRCAEIEFVRRLDGQTEQDRGVAVMNVELVVVVREPNGDLGQNDPADERLTARESGAAGRQP